MKRLHKALSACLLLVVVLASVPVYAEELSSERVEQFISTLSDLEELGKEYRETDAFREMGKDIQEAARKGEFKPMRMMVERLEDHEMFDEFSGVVSEHGFENPSQWAETGDRVMRAMMAIQMESRDTANMKQEMQAMMDRLKQDPSVTEQQRKRMKQQMETAMAGMDAMADAPEADIEVVRPYRDKLMKAMED